MLRQRGFELPSGKFWGLLLLYSVSAALGFLNSGPAIITWLIWGDDPVAMIHPQTGLPFVTKANEPSLFNWIVVSVPWVVYFYVMKDLNTIEDGG